MIRLGSFPLDTAELCLLCVATTPWEIFLAFWIEDETRLGFWDALIVAAAIKSDADRVLSEDLNADDLRSPNRESVCEDALSHHVWRLSPTVISVNIRASHQRSRQLWKSRVRTAFTDLEGSSRFSCAQPRFVCCTRSCTDCCSLNCRQSVPGLERLHRSRPTLHRPCTIFRSPRGFFLWTPTAEKNCT